ncbi:hypothetical protein H4R99_008508, partial [Coemansia sp. RSA 1722]
LFASNNAPRRHQEPPRQQGHPFRLPSQQQHREQRSVPGYPYIRFIEDDDLDGGYPFDAFQDLRSAYFASPLSDIQSRMRNLQHQRAQSQLRRALLEQQLREHEQRERELLEYQQRLEHERRAHAKAAADRARAAYLSRLEKEEQQRQLDALCAARHAASEKASAQRNTLAVDGSDDDDDDERAVFYPPFHFFNHILNNQIRSQDDIERKRAEKNALNNLLEAYFGQATSGGGEQKENAAAVSRESSAGVKQGSRSPTKLNMSASESSLNAQPVSMVTSSTNVAGNQSPSLSSAVNAAPARQLPPFGIRSSQLDPGVLDNVLRVVHDRLAEIAAAEESEKQKSASASGSSAENSSDIDVDVVDEEEEEPSHNEKTNLDDPEPTVDETQKGVEVEEPTDYGKLADTLRRRVGDLNDDNMFLPLSPLLASHDDEDSDSEPQPTLAHKPQKQHTAAIDPVTITVTDNNDDVNRHMDVECDDAEHSDKEFADMLSSCKNQLKDLTEATTKHDSEAAHRRRSRRRQNHRSRSRRHRNHHQQQQVESTTAASDTAAAPPSTQKTPVTAEAPKPEETEEQRQKRAVTTIEDYILGARKARKAKE